MFMSSPNVSINDASFIDLGRSDKTFPLTAKFANGVLPGASPAVTTSGSATQFNSNMRGRYPVHFHKVGATQANPITFTDNVVWGSPGWGVSLHSSFANISGNISYNVFAAHFVTEDGDEKGHIHHNLAVKAVGDTVDDFQVDTIGGAPESLQRKLNKGYYAVDTDYNASGTPIAYTKIQDDGQTGNCFWMQSRNVEFTDNLANSCAKAGFVFFHRHVNSTPTPWTNLASPHKTFMMWHKKISNTVLPTLESNEVIIGAANNKATASHGAFSVIKANNEQFHNVFSHIKGTRGFNMGGACLEFGYTGKYLVEDSECYATPGLATVEDVAIDTNTLVENIIFNGFKTVGWDYPVDSNLIYQNVLSPPALTFINGFVQLTTGGLVPFNPAQHLWEFNKFPRVSSYNPDIHKVVAWNSNMAEGSGFTPSLSNIQLFSINPSQTGWQNLIYHWSATLTDSAGVAQSSPSLNINSFESAWPGQAVRARYMEQVGGVYVNRTTNAQGNPCVTLHDHFMDRVNRTVVPIDICIPY